VDKKTEIKAIEGLLSYLNKNYRVPQLKGQSPWAKKEETKSDKLDKAVAKENKNNKGYELDASEYCGIVDKNDPNCTTAETGPVIKSMSRAGRNKKRNN